MTTRSVLIRSTLLTTGESKLIVTVPGSSSLNAVTLFTADLGTSMRPAPMRPRPNLRPAELTPWKRSWRAPFISSALSSSTDQSGWSCRSRAMVPAMCGVAIEVPDRISTWPPGRKPVGSGTMQPWLPDVQVMPDWSDGIATPGAVASGFSPIGKEPPPRGPREVNEARVSAALAEASVALTPLAAARSLPLSLEMNSAAMVMFGWEGSPPMLIRLGSPAMLLKTMAPMAPAACALATFFWKVQLPRMISAMLPLMALALV